VKIKGEDYAILPGVAGDKFLLVSMCFDDRYTKTALGYSIAHDLGQFPLQWRFVRLLIDDVDQGAYLQLEHPVDALENSQLALVAVVRRRKDFFRGEVRVPPRALSSPPAWQVLYPYPFSALV
jgi:hypothetical protein